MSTEPRDLISNLQIINLKKESMDIVCLGEILIDMFPAEIGRRLVEVSAFHPKPGGAPANVAVAAARLGAKSAFIGKVGDDAFGRFLLETLAQEQVDTRGLRLDPAARTTMAFIALPDPHQAEFVFYRNPGADTLLRPDELEQEQLQQTRAFHFGSVSLSLEPCRSATLAAARLAKEAGALVSFDVNYRPSLWPHPDEALSVIRNALPLARLIKVNLAELELLTGSSDLESGSQTLLGQGLDLVVVTLGPKGSFFRSAQGSGHVAGFTVPTVDAIGCGDAFTAGLLTQLISLPLAEKGLPHRQLSPERLHQILRYANAVGALTATKQGVIPALPTAKAVDAFLREHTH
jgi:fructokinase